MLQLHYENYQISVSDVPIFSSESVDNVESFDRVHQFGTRENHVTSRHGIRIHDAGNEIASCILLSGGGASGVHEHSAVLYDSNLAVAVGPYIVSLSVPDLELNWAIETDSATCFGVYLSKKHQCLISHGELEIARVSFDGEIAWQAGGVDIFTNGFALHDDRVDAIDWNGQAYHIDIDSGQEVS